MNLQRIWVPLAGIALVAFAYSRYGWQGVAVAGGGIVMFLLLHFTRTLAVLKRAADRPIGYVRSAVMLNAKLKSDMALLHVVAMTRALGELRSPEGAQPECYRWTDPGGAHVEAWFHGGKLREWALARPPAVDETAGEAVADDRGEAGGAA